MFQSPAKTANICCAESLLALTFKKEKPIGKLFLHEFPHDVGSAIWTPIVYHEYVKTFLEVAYGTYDFLDILLLVICGNDDDAVTCMYCIHVCILWLPYSNFAEALCKDSKLC